MSSPRQSTTSTIESGNLAESALWYAQHGFPVFPLAPQSKKPATPNGFKDATTDVQKVEEWWQKMPRANIGIPMGTVSGLIALDIDPRHAGDSELERLVAENGPMPETAEQITGGQGRHYVFQHPGGRIRSCDLAPGVELKADGTYIVVAPSIHPQTQKAYQWDGIEGEHSLLQVSKPPGWLLALPREPIAQRQANPSAKIPEGERNKTLASLAGSMRRRGMSLRAIEAALLAENGDRCEPPLPEDEVRRIATSISSYDANPESWPELCPIGAELPPVLVFSEELLPNSFRTFVRDIAERMQVPMDYPAAAVVLCLAGAVNRRAVIQPKASDSGWRVVPNLWGGIIAPPGMLKSPVLAAATRPLDQIQLEWLQEHEESERQHEREVEEWALQDAVWKGQYKTALKTGRTTPARQAERPEPPTLKRIIVNDATFEKLHVIMAENPLGILVVRDELTGWWGTLDRQGREGERAFCLEAWNGNRGFTIDRIGRGTIHVEACCMSMLGGIQPGRLRSYLSDALADGPTNDGLIQRFQVLVWPDTKPDWKLVDRGPNLEAEAIVREIFRKLVRLCEPEGSASVCHFSANAQDLFYDWLQETEAKVRGGELHSALESHLSKYRSLMPSLALLFHLADCAASGSAEDAVSLEHARLAAAWCEYLESHARRVYSCVTTPQLRAARELAGKIQQRKVPLSDNRFTLRDVYLKGWTSLDSPEAVRMAAEVLVDAGWLREPPSEHRPRGGRPSNRFEVNPKVWK